MLFEKFSRVPILNMRLFHRFTTKVLLPSCLSLVSCFHEKSKLLCEPGYDYFNASVYEPCSEFVFRAKYWYDGELVSDENISVFITGNHWQYDSSQAEALLLYNSDYDQSSIERIRSFGINPEINERKWVNQSTTGIIDNENMVFLHPFRDNQYYFTEIAPFPEVFFPFYLGKTWTGKLNIGAGWGIWDGQRIETSYEVVKKESLIISGKKYDNCWKISSRANSTFGVSSLNTWFHDEFGFIKYNYITYAGQILQLELVEVVRH